MAERQRALLKLGHRGKAGLPLLPAGHGDPMDMEREVIIDEGCREGSRQQKEGGGRSRNQLKRKLKLQ